MSPSIIRGGDDSQGRKCLLAICVCSDRALAVPHRVDHLWSDKRSYLSSQSCIPALVLFHYFYCREVSVVPHSPHKQALELPQFASSWYTMTISFLSSLFLQHAGHRDGILEEDDVIGQVQGSCCTLLLYTHQPSRLDPRSQICTYSPMTYVHPSGPIHTSCRLLASTSNLPPTPNVSLVGLASSGYETVS